jgi:Zn ribbon nucleic-acid-binding protein
MAITSEMDRKRFEKLTGARIPEGLSVDELKIWFEGFQEAMRLVNVAVAETVGPLLG